MRTTSVDMVLKFPFTGVFVFLIAAAVYAGTRKMYTCHCFGEALINGTPSLNFSRNFFSSGEPCPFENYCSARYVSDGLGYGNGTEVKLKHLQTSQVPTSYWEHYEPLAVLHVTLLIALLLTHGFYICAIAGPQLCPPQRQRYNSPELNQ